ncbi:unnamed protein product [Caenorhabditis sp. 36 PRJEB53466]|nr:unnamed protein product [Caenorhabditis sp. 36 PRJEB53466]
MRPGSVSPPAPAPKVASRDPDKAKTLFAKKIRERYSKEGSISREELERKIEQLWKGLTSTQKEQFIRLNNVGDAKLGNQKENIANVSKKQLPAPANSTARPQNGVKPIVPVLERRNNCKAIAKVLDLRSDGPSLSHTPSYAETMKVRMRAYTMEASLAACRRVGNIVSNPVEHTDMSSLQDSIPPFEESCEKVTRQIPEEVYSPPVPESSILPTTSPEPRIANISSANSVARRPLVKKSRIVKRSVRQFVPKISYSEASGKYYEILSQSLLLNPVNTSTLQLFADIMEGCSVVRVYSFEDCL